MPFCGVARHSKLRCAVRWYEGRTGRVVVLLDAHRGVVAHVPQPLLQRQQCRLARHRRGAASSHAVRGAREGVDALLRALPQHERLERAVTLEGELAELTCENCCRRISGLLILLPWLTGCS